MSFELLSLGSHPFGHCFVLKFNDVTLMLDCSLDLTSLAHFLPVPLVPSKRLESLKCLEDHSISKKLAQHIKEVYSNYFLNGQLEFCTPEFGALDLSTIDAILISNFRCMLALPFITEYSSFCGKVFATEPTVRFGQQLMEELLYMTERVCKQSVPSQWKTRECKDRLPPSLKNAVDTHCWRSLYNETDVSRCLSKIRIVGCSQKLDLYGSVELVSLSSGYCLGSCNWLIQTPYQKIGYLTSSSQLTTHALPLDRTSMHNCDVLLMTGGLTEAPAVTPDGMVGEFCTQLARTLQNGGNVLVPCSPTGVIYDLLECLPAYLDNMGLQHVPLYFLSPVAETSLAYSNICGEWCCKPRQDKMYMPEPPFGHSELLKNNRLQSFKSVADGLSDVYKTPCVVFCGHPSLRCGDTVHFMEVWGPGSQNSVIFIETGFQAGDPTYPLAQVLAPYQPLAMKVFWCPIDPRLDFQQAKLLLRDLQPRHTIIPESYLRPPLTMPQRVDLALDLEGPISTFTRGDVVSLSLDMKFSRATVAPTLAASLIPREIQPGVAVTSIQASLYSHDNRHTLRALTQQFSAAGIPDHKVGSGKLEEGEIQEQEREVKQKSRLVGDVSVDGLVQELSRRGLLLVQEEVTHQGHRLIAGDASILIQDGSVHVTAPAGSKSRKEISRCLLSQLQSI